MTKNITVYGLVQGVGFRPYIKRLANKYGIGGNVCNTDGAVQITATANEAALKDFETAIIACAPKGAVIDRIDSEEQEEGEAYADDAFEIIESIKSQLPLLPYIPADIATCDECGRQLAEAGNRRYRHPFISCALCGPRYSIMKSIPYDRENTVMEQFELCPQCRREYENTADRRCYAQTIACKNCGPVLAFNGEKSGCMEKTIDALKNGRIVAIKDIGGYHFACDALNNDAVERLREIKLREAKPFAVMFRDVSNIEEYAIVDELEREVLCSPAKPIVLLRKKTGMEGLAVSVCGASRYVGGMLPCNPVQIMLMDSCGPLVMTSGNISGEPVIINDMLLKQLADKYDFDVLSHNRDIVMPLDDSIVRVICGRVQVIRRGRGYTPEPLDVEQIKATGVFAAGGDLKSAFAIAQGKRIILSEHFGDLENPKAFAEYIRQKRHMEDMYGFVPEKILCDMHPGYFSSNYAQNSVSGCQVKKVQHHLAHIASVAAEFGIVSSYMGFAFDGTGYGTDGAIWGGEVFSVDGKKVRRKYHLSYMKMPASDMAAKDAKLLSQYYMYQAGAGKYGLTEDAEAFNIIEKAIAFGINVVDTSSMGRLFDAVSAITGICGYNRYEGECAEALEKEACQWKRSNQEKEPEPDMSAIPEIKFRIAGDEILTEPLIIGVCKAVLDGVPRGKIAYAFHRAVVDMMIDICHRENAENVVVSGGVFMNRIIMEEFAECELKEQGVHIFFNEKIPVTDGGIAVGQIWAEERGYELCV